MSFYVTKMEIHEKEPKENVEQSAYPDRRSSDNLLHLDKLLGQSDVMGMGIFADFTDLAVRRIFNLIFSGNADIGGADAGGNSGRWDEFSRSTI